ncbi:DUF4157 domain-containing protein [Pseudanabaena sp. BC1403]|uniref:eCIS core domain-containing protein n=1 Tax=Pseudanabaena sp. BC1403 TaxID=2043171 RepID=UPI000CD98ACA|nr:DUF4157 domain-containing protein [Pseudanabaena sp. BC1403]
MFTSDFEKKPTQSTASVKPTTSFFQTRAFAPPQTDESAPPPQYRYSENIQEKLINQPSTQSSDTRIQAKPKEPLRAIASLREIQAKLNIGEPNDKYEKEADVTAARVVHQINSPNNPSVNSSIQDPPIQRQELGEEQELGERQKLQRKPLLQRLQRRKDIAKGEASSDLESSIQSARGRGQSLDKKLQRSMGQAMAADFSNVTVHTDSQSDQLNKSIQAKAFTTGQDVFFRQGEYNPNSKSGQELIAHELTHVVQQDANKIKRMMNEDESPKTIQKIVREVKEEKGWTGANYSEDWECINICNEVKQRISGWELCTVSGYVLVAGGIIPEGTRNGNTGGIENYWRFEMHVYLRNNDGELYDPTFERAIEEGDIEVGVKDEGMWGGEDTEFDYWRFDMGGGMVGTGGESGCFYLFPTEKLLIEAVADHTTDVGRFWQVIDSDDDEEE